MVGVAPAHLAMFENGAQDPSPAEEKAPCLSSQCVPLFERLAGLAVQLVAIGNREPHLSGSERVSLLLAAQLVSGVRDLWVQRIASLN